MEATVVEEDIADEDIVVAAVDKRVEVDIVAAVAPASG